MEAEEEEDDDEDEERQDDDGSEEGVEDNANTSAASGQKGHKRALSLSLSHTHTHTHLIWIRVGDEVIVKEVDAENGV